MKYNKVLNAEFLDRCIKHSLFHSDNLFSVSTQIKVYYFSLTCYCVLKIASTTAEMILSSRKSLVMIWISGPTVDFHCSLLSICWSSIISFPVQLQFSCCCYILFKRYEIYGDHGYSSIHKYPNHISVTYFWEKCWAKADSENTQAI